MFLRSLGGSDPAQSLYVLDVASGVERLLIEGVGDNTPIPEDELARRERVREPASGIVDYSVDSTGARAAAVVEGSLLIADIETKVTRTFEIAPGAHSPQLAPGGTRGAYCANGALHVLDFESVQGRVISDSDATWGVPEFVASEEFQRTKGFWWSPCGRWLLAQRVDEGLVPVWHIATPEAPWLSARPMRYPQAGAPNVGWELAVVDVDDHESQPQGLGLEGHEYLVDVRWDDEALLVTMLDRHQRTKTIIQVEPVQWSGRVRHVVRDDAWVQPVRGSPRIAQGRLVTVEDIDEARSLCVDGRPVTAPDVQVREIVSTDERGIVVVASIGDPTATHVALVGWTGSFEVLTKSEGVHGAVASGSTMVLLSEDLLSDGIAVAVELVGRGPVASIESRAATPPLVPRPEFHLLGQRALRSALLLPSGQVQNRLPVVVDSYGGPLIQRVLRKRSAFTTSQWLADQGFAVLVVDGRGTPGRGPSWERAVRGDLASPILEDQIDALFDAASKDERLDLTAVGIRGWSFGGYLAALAVLRRPDVFHAAVAGAPVTDWRLYDTAYAERYLGLPFESEPAYEACSLIRAASRLTRPLLLLHGYGDDNVHFVHSAQLSCEFVLHGRPHTMVPLVSTTHRANDPKVAASLLKLQLEFLRTELLGRSGRQVEQERVL